METIEELAKRGEQHDVVDALRLLTKAYIEMCGISTDYRTIVRYAAEQWQEKLAWMDLPLSKTARKKTIIGFMPYINKDFAEGGYDMEDIGYMRKKDRQDCCKQMVEEETFDKQTLEVLCWGLLDSITTKDESKNLEATAGDGTQLKGCLLDNSCGYARITMTSPYEVGVYVIKRELIRDANELIEIYNACQKLYKMEEVARSLYPKYQAELEKKKNEDDYKKIEVFRKVYRAIIYKTIIHPSSIEDLFDEWWGLKFYKWK